MVVIVYLIRMEKQIFRKKSLKKLDENDNSSPYVKVVHPTVWVSLGIVIALLAGFLTWGFLGKVEIKITGVGEIKDGVLTNYIKSNYYQGVKVGQTIKFSNKTCKITAIDLDPIKVSKTEFSEYLINLGGLVVGEYVYKSTANIDTSDAYVITQTVTDIVAPLPYVFR